MGDHSREEEVSATTAVAIGLTVMNCAFPSVVPRGQRRRDTCSPTYRGPPCRQRPPLVPAAKGATEVTMQRVIRAVYENGVLKPLDRVRMRERKVCLLSIYPEEEWRKDFEALLGRIHRRTRRHASADIEADITAARAEVKAKRREARRSA